MIECQMIMYVFGFNKEDLSIELKLEVMHHSLEFAADSEIQLFI